MKANSAVALEWLKKLRECPEGACLELPPLIPALSPTLVQAFLVEKEDTSWTLACYWNGVAIGDIQAHLEGTNFILEDV